MIMESDLATIVTSLRQIQTEGDDIASNFVILIADNEKNYYIQFATGHDETPLGGDAASLYSEAVGNEVLRPEFALSPEQIARLQSLGWKPAPATPNFYRTWKAADDNDRRLIAQEVMRAFTEVYGLPRNRAIEVELTIA